MKELIRWLKSRHCVVKEISNNYIIFLQEGFWGCIYYKDHKNSPVPQSIKKEIEKFSEWSWASVAYPGEKMKQIKEELKEMLCD